MAQEKRGLSADWQFVAPATDRNRAIGDGKIDFLVLIHHQFAFASRRQFECDMAVAARAGGGESQGPQDCERIEFEPLQVAKLGCNLKSLEPRGERLQSE